MRSTLKQVFHSPKFVIGFFIFALILLAMWIYPLIVPGNPLENLGLGTFFKPGTYISTYDAIDTEKYVLKISDEQENRLDNKISAEDKVSIVEWLSLKGVSLDGVKTDDTRQLISLWSQNYDTSIRIDGMTMAKRNYYKRLNEKIKMLENPGEYQVMMTQNGEQEEVARIQSGEYVNVKDIANVKVLPLGTDNFGRDVLKELLAATKTSIKIGLIAGTIATLIGLVLGLLAGYLGGIADDIIMFITNIFTVIPSFVLLILISYGISQDQRGATTVAIVIGLTSWIWTTRSVRSQVISLRNRDHVNLSKLSGHSLFRIIFADILPYIASYVVMAFILQISTAILAEAQLSILGLGPKTTETPTLGLMMNWAMLYSAHLNGSWWAYFPVILVIALISFSLNLMNTGLDQVFNPTLRE